MKAQFFSRRTVLATAAAALVVGGLSTAAARAEFPERPIELIIPFGAGGGADIEGRLLAQEMSKVLGVAVVPVNKPGAGGAVTYTFVKDSAPDGYTVAWNSTSILSTTNIGNVGYAHDAFDHIGQVEYQPMPFAVRADAPWQTFQDFVDACKAEPGKYKIANSTTGSATHLAALAIQNAIGCDVVHLPVGVERRNAALLGGEADAMVAPLTGAIKLAKAGKIRLLVIPSAKRNELIPDVPTAKELGFDADIDLFRGLSVAKGTPDDVKAKLTDAMVQAGKSEAFMAFAADKGFTVEPITGADFAAMLAAQDTKVKAILDAAGLLEAPKQ